jgi:CubicO group peptidase (beta-lactamase class C family)
MSDAAYLPAPGDDRWERRQPAEVGLDGDRLAEAVAWAEQHETRFARNLQDALDDLTQGEGEYAAIVGPTKPRGGPAGLILRHGYIAAEWGDPARVDMTFSASKSYLATLAGLALDRGLIRDLDDPVREYVNDGGFDPPHNSKITWRHLLQQTSEWTGTLWGKPDQVDHNRGVGDTQANFATKGTRREGVQRRPRQPPRPGAAAGLGPLAARRIQRARHGPDRRVRHLGVARLQQLVR